MKWGGEGGKPKLFIFYFKKWKSCIILDKRQRRKENKKILRLFKKSYFIFEFGKETWRMRDMDGTVF